MWSGSHDASDPIVMFGVKAKTIAGPANWFRRPGPRAVCRLIVGVLVAFALGSCTRQTCPGSCGPGQYCRTIDFRCVWECKDDRDCHQGSFCSPTCGVCIRCDQACPVASRSGPTALDDLGACLPFGDGGMSERCATKPTMVLMCGGSDAGDNMSVTDGAVDDADATNDVPAADVSDSADSAAEGGAGHE
jgi:hypothetical protein